MDGYLGQNFLDKKKQKYKKNNMKKLKTFESYVDDAEESGLYDDMSELLDKANILICNYKGINPEENNEASDPEETNDSLAKIATPEAINLIKEINDKSTEIDEMESESYYNEDDEISESVGDLEDSFVKINIDETDLEDSDRKKSGKLNQKTGNIIIENPSKTDEYNAKMRLGGEVIVDTKFPEKSIHHVKSFNDFH